ncbi:MAG TPA: signal recognition particle protein, partial [Tepidimicrobium sp.]|nr:signal recognition particle protein [Tepidimicrobium sp.]
LRIVIISLSVGNGTGPEKPIKFVGMGEKLDQLEPFYPDRMSSRILGMGDVLSLIERAQSSIDEQKALELGEKIRSQQFTLDDFLDQLDQMQNLGPLDEILGMLPGVNSKALKGLDVNEKDIVRVRGIIQSMTPEEREDPAIINSSRRKRIAKGSGTKVQDVNRLLRQFRESKKMMKRFANLEKTMKRKGKIGFPFF